jgi:hypothetical protein
MKNERLREEESSYEKIAIFIYMLNNYLSGYYLGNTSIKGKLLMYLGNTTDLRLFLFFV